MSNDNPRNNPRNPSDKASPLATLAPLTVLLAAPRGFCAGVERAIAIVERAIKKYGAPVFVRHEIVHNQFVVDDLKAKGAVFVEEIDEIPKALRTTRPVIFSAHGVPKSVIAQAVELNIPFIDATCPLVEKVHREAQRFARENRQILLVGHKGHPEVTGTMGQLTQTNPAKERKTARAQCNDHVITPNSTSATTQNQPIVLIETLAQVEEFVAKTQDQENQDQETQDQHRRKRAYITQTTLSLDDTREITQALKKHFPNITSPKKDDICYATANRQNAVKAFAARCDMFFVIGASNSSNSMRLLEIAKTRAKYATLLRDERDLPEIPPSTQTIGITASASAPEILVQRLLTHLRKSRSLIIESVTTEVESVVFKIPKSLEQTS